MADMFNKVTGEYRTSQHSPDYANDTDWIQNPDTSAVDNVDRKFWVWDTGILIREKTTAEKDADDTAALPSAKLAWIGAMKAKTVTLQAAGHLHGGFTYSLEEKALTRTIGAAERKAQNKLALPFRVPNIDGTAMTTFTTEADVEAWVESVHNRVRVLHDDECDLIELVMAATTLTELAAIPDTR